MRIIFALTICLSFISNCSTAATPATQAVENPPESKKEYSKLTRAHLELLVSLIAKDIQSADQADITANLKEKYSETGKSTTKYTVVEKAHSKNLFIVANTEARVGIYLSAKTPVDKVFQECNAEFYSKKGWFQGQPHIVEPDTCSQCAYYSNGSVNLLYPKYYYDCHFEVPKELINQIYKEQLEKKAAEAEIIKTAQKK
jgi:hypothetical protein